MEFSTQYMLLTIIVGFILGALASVMADNRGRDGRIWFFLGFFFGLLSLIALFLLPNLADSESEETEVEESLPEPQIESAETKEWFYLEEGTAQVGPVTFEELSRLYEDKKISSTTYVWSEGMEEWKTVEECELFTS